MSKFRLQVLAIQLAVVVVVLGCWQLASLNAGFSFAVSTPAATAREIGALFGEDSFRRAMVTTFGEVGIAMLIGIPCTAALGLISASLPSRLDRYFDSLTQLGLATPQSVLLPIFIFLFGVGFMEIVIVAIAHLVFVVFLNARSAAKSIPDEVAKTAHFYGAKGLTLIRKIYIPYMAPTVMQAVRLGFVFSIIGVLVAQLYAATGDGIGVLLIKWSSIDAKTALTASVLALTILTIIVNQVLFRIERHFTKWQD